MVDTTVLIAGSGWPRWPREVLLDGLRREFQLVLSPYVIRQAHRNLSKRFPEHLARFEAFLFQANFELAPDPTPEEVAQYKGLVRDESDLPIVLAAIKAGVDYLVSEDKDLTARDETTARLHEKLTVMLSGTFLRQMMGWTSDELEAVRHRTWADFEED
jgi:predicted nucleic acid-binding protein